MKRFVRNKAHIAVLTVPMIVSNLAVSYAEDSVVVATQEEVVESVEEEKDEDDTEGLEEIETNENTTEDVQESETAEDSAEDVQEVVEEDAQETEENTQEDVQEIDEENKETTEEKITVENTELIQNLQPNKEIKVAEQNSETHVLNVSDLAAATYTSTTYADGTFFAINADSTNTVVVESNSKNGDNGNSYTQRLKLGGTNQNIAFTMPSSGSISVHALSGSTGSNRKLALYKADGTKISEVDAMGTENPIILRTIEISEAGDYYLASTNSGVNIYYLSVLVGDAPVVEREAWDQVESPVLNSATVSGGNIDVDFSMDFGVDGADTVEVLLKNVDTGSVDKKTCVKQEVVSLTPATSGTYEVQVVAKRSDEATEKTSNTITINNFSRPLDQPTVTKLLTGKNNNLNVSWGAVKEAESYKVEYKKASDDTYTTVVDNTTDLEVTIQDLTPLETYDVKITAIRGTDESSVTVSKKLEETAERWQIENVGTTTGKVSVNEAGEIVFNAKTATSKLATSEDQFSYYFTEIDPETENYTLTATFRVDDASTADNQSGFGIMAIDSMQGDISSSKYHNSVSSLVARSKSQDGSTVLYGVPSYRAVSGYTQNPSMSSPTRTLSESAFVDDWNSDLSTTYKFKTGEVYTLVLRKSNTGYHSYMVDADGNKISETINYEKDALHIQDTDKEYVGFVAARKIDVTVTDYDFTVIKPEDDEAPLERPVTYVTPNIAMDTTRTTSSNSYSAGLRSNVNGTLQILDASGNVVKSDIPVENNERVLVDLALQDGTNNFKAVFTPNERANQTFLGQFEDLKSYEPIEYSFSVDVKRYGTESNAIYVSPQGTANGKGTKASPLDIHTAVAYAQPGQEIVLLGGTYKLTSGVSIERGNDGTAGKYKVLTAAPGEKVTLDLANSSTGGLFLKGDYWHVYGLEIINSQGAKKPVHVIGNHNILERLSVHDNGDTGVQISGYAEETLEMWPSYNLILSTESYNNCDPTGNDADGFAAKITAGVGNEFRYCISHNNIDDGWDLYAKSTSGSIGNVLVDRSVAYNNGYLTTDPNITKYGEGNGFKLGGESMPGAHTLSNSITFGNIAKGVTSNSGPDPKVKKVTSYSNGKVQGASNISLYTNANTIATNYEVDGFISYKGEKADEFKLQQQASLNSATNYFDGKNTENVQVTDEWFKSLDTTIVPTYNEDGTINMHGLLELTNVVPNGVGGNVSVLDGYVKPNKIVIGEELNTTDEGGTDEGGTDNSTDDDSQSDNSSTGTYSKPETSKVTEVTINDIKNAKNNEIVISNANNSEIVIKADLIKNLLDTNNTIKLVNGRTTIRLSPKFIAEVAKSTTNDLKIMPTVKSEEDVAKVSALIKGNQSINNELLKNTLQITVDDKITTNFTQPIAITIDLKDYSLTEAQKEKLCGVGVDGKLHKLGGEYDKATNTFTFNATKQGDFAICVIEDLVKIGMSKNNPTIVVNGEEKTMDVNPFIVDGHTVVPVRFVAEALGLDVKWDGATKVITITDGVKTIILDSKSNDGTENPILKDSRVFVPLRYVSEQFDSEVTWNEEEQSIAILR